ncbi:uncharacterized protein LOC124363340 [Homalodisca vitripennis]|uniref:uncharacterized protein LOC124363340 n=1 Tax=Homalodisca vitripennis TaxID=197043 RepID=UPI001EE9D0B2|nr:uncharacterized protein LOC124363340 [Homalodisca vitripennis]
MQTLSERGVSVELGGERLAVKNSVKTLGVVLDSNLTFSEHVTFSVQRALGCLKGLHRYRTLLPECAKMQIMQSMVLCVFNCCYPNSTTKEDAGRIQRLQNSAIRFIFSLSKFDHVSPSRKDANIIAMQDVCRMMTCCMVHKASYYQQLVLCYTSTSPVYCLLTSARLLTTSSWSFVTLPPRLCTARSPLLGFLLPAAGPLLHFHLACVLLAHLC